jgi:hypothetical protein
MSVETKHPSELSDGGVSLANTLEARVVDGTLWDHHIADFDDVCQEQLHIFAATRWPNVEHQPLLFEQNGAIVGGALVMLQPLPLGLADLAVVKWAPMLKDSRRPDAQKLREAMIETLITHYATGPKQLLSLLPRNALTQSNPELDYVLARGFRRGAPLGFPSRYLVNLRLSDEEQRKSFQQTWRRQLIKSEKAGLSFEHAPASAFGDFDALYRAMTDRKQFADYSAYGTLPSLMGIHKSGLRPELFYVRHNGELVAGAVIFTAGDRAVYLYGATNDAALPLRAGYFMHWHIIRWLRDNTKATWYDLGGTDGFQGLHQFKKGMVGEAGIITPLPPVMNYATSKWAMLLGHTAFAARDGYHNIRRKIEGWRNPKSRATQLRDSSHEPVT